MNAPPFLLWKERKIAKQNAKRRRLIRAGKAMTKDELAKQAAEAVKTHPIRRV